MILINVKFPVRADQADRWQELANKYAAQVHAEEGNLFFEWSRSVAEPDTWVCIEGGFRDSEAGTAHVATTAFSDFVDQASDLVAAQPEIIYVDAPEVAGFGPMGEIQPRHH